MDEEKLEQVADRLHMFLPLLYKKVMAWHKECDGYNPGHYMVLGTLMNTGPLSMSELGRRMYVSKPNMTVLTERLIQEGMLERKSDASDRRVIHVSLTDDGIRFMKKHRAETREELKKKLSTLGDEDIDALCESLDRVRTIISKLNVEE